MTKVLLFSALLLGSLSTYANDGGTAAIKVNDIHMREFKYENGVEKEVRRIVKPNFRITFSGGEAANLQKILPSQLSVITMMQPEIATQFNASFKALGIYSEGTRQVSSKVLIISCADANIESVGDDGKVKIVKTGQSECTIEINGIDEGADASDYLGGMKTYAPSCQP